MGLHDSPFSPTPIAITKLLDAGADPNRPFRSITLALQNDHGIYMQSSKALSPWELLISISPLFYIPESPHSYGDITLAINAFIAKGANLHTTSLTTASTLLESGHMPTFVIEISPLSFISSTDDADRSLHDIDMSRMKPILQSLEGQNAPSHMRIRAFHNAVPSWRYKWTVGGWTMENKEDEEIGRDADVKNNRNVQRPEKVESAKNANISGEGNNGENDENIANPDSESNDENESRNKDASYFLQRKVYILSTDDSQTLLDLVLKFFPKFPTNIQMASDMEKMLKDEEFLYFFRSRSHLHSKETIILPSWLEPGVDGSVGQAKPED